MDQASAGTRFIIQDGNLGVPTGSEGRPGGLVVPNSNIGNNKLLRFVSNIGLLVTALDSAGMDRESVEIFEESEL